MHAHTDFLCLSHAQKIVTLFQHTHDPASALVFVMLHMLLGTRTHPPLYPVHFMPCAQIYCRRGCGRVWKSASTSFNSQQGSADSSPFPRSQHASATQKLPMSMHLHHMRTHHLHAAFDTLCTKCFAMLKVRCTECLTLCTLFLI